MNLSKDVLCLIMLELNFKDLYNYSLTFSKMNKLLDISFWYNKLKKDYGLDTIWFLEEHKTF